MRGRADIPSAKKSLGSSGSYFGCIVIRGPQTTKTTIRISALPRDIRDLPRIERLQEIPHSVEIEFWIARLDDQEEFVARGLIESRHVKDRVIRHRQAVERQHAEHRRKSGYQYRAFERDRNPGRPTVERPSADVERIADDVRVPAHEESTHSADEAAEEDDDRELGVMHADGSVPTVNRKRRKSVD